ncbi:hypothetical protein [Halorubrum sp. CSM-61]|uniref:hypothetical protein n=1 Tax=Halorubrum sp. CSM-61 TaxID=2485838 RepID=UPI000F4B33AE|nr:hypothetical protein [Halorubrum sp. CSM-61]
MTEGDPSGTGGPDRIRSIAVHRDDVATALEATLRSDREVVLRVTPPFSGRMRARIHAVDGGDEEGSGGDGPAPIHVDPRDLVSDVPPYPEVDETMAENPDADVETRRKRHTDAVESWREAVRESVVDGVELDVGDERAVEVDVTALG